MVHHVRGQLQVVVHKLPVVLLRVEPPDLLALVVLELVVMAVAVAAVTTAVLVAHPIRVVVVDPVGHQAVFLVQLTHKASQIQQQTAHSHFLLWATLLPPLCSV